MRKVMISGTGMTHFGKHMDATIRSLTVDALAQALTDANATTDHVDTIFFGNAAAGLLTGQEMIPGQVALRESGLMGKPIINVENACASSSTAAHLAWLSVASGQCEVALAIGAEKMTNKDKAVPFKALIAAMDLEQIKAETGSDDPLEAGMAPGRSGFMDIYAGKARKYMEEAGATIEDFARVAAKSHKFGSLNPKAQFQNALSVEDILASRDIIDPLKLAMCSPIGDGAAVLVFTSEDFVKKHGCDAVVAETITLVTGMPGGPNCNDRASEKAYNAAGIGPEDIDVVELHDAASPAELMYIEELGLCGKGEGVRMIREGQTDLGGKVPVNTSGGLVAKGHPVGATGCAQIVELADQLRGRCGARQVEGAKVALAQNGGGWIEDDTAVTTLTVLTR
ncbi:MAG: thiolase family protein [Gammaproteobacteria bacterium]|nr:MAG: thiolase family protein [Gammaproteobacteria bacterium]